MYPATCAITVDLDPLRFYSQIHGLAEVTTAFCPVYSTAIERLSAWAQSLGIPVTWFVVGSELSSESVVLRLRRLHERGDELSNHSEHHYYDLTNRSSFEMRNEIESVLHKLAVITGEKSFGFRAPGYRITDELVSVLRSTNTLYDSSLFPCPLYWATKAAVLLRQRMGGRRSHSILDHPKVLFGPRLPYRMGQDYLHHGHGLLELPITVTPGIRLPFIGTSLSLLGRTAAVQLTRTLTKQTFVNLELHGIDVLDKFDGLEGLADVQPDLRISWHSKLDTLTAVVSVLRHAGFSFATLRDHVNCSI